MFIMFLWKGFPVLIFCIRVFLKDFTKPASFVWALVGSRKLLFLFNSERQPLLSSPRFWQCLFEKHAFLFVFHTTCRTYWLICWNIQFRCPLFQYIQYCHFLSFVYQSVNYQKFQQHCSTSCCDNLKKDWIVLLEVLTFSDNES